jgi:hypothetical protein
VQWRTEKRYRNAGRAEHNQSAEALCRTEQRAAEQQDGSRRYRNIDKLKRQDVQQTGHGGRQQADDNGALGASAVGIVPDQIRETSDAAN